ncbi:hypothetical protein BDV39DRAFT_180503 [Aspergillus sergii]|uniref:Uncharacterized protein n=1 Tax=Aspergillus sergii TaxID=1034303 RepID=A0A5N6WV07_9EURO|nr:hypothetical protein BDV39DRAFT_180503 [Aspergillus sergii]
MTPATSISFQVLSTSMCLDREELRPASTDFVWVTQDPLQQTLNSLSPDVLRGSSGGFVLVEASEKGEADNMYLEGLLCTPRAFYCERQSTYKDVAFEEDFPGRHRAFFDSLITSKQMTLV